MNNTEKALLFVTGQSMITEKQEFPSSVVVFAESKLHQKLHQPRNKTVETSLYVHILKLR